MAAAAFDDRCLGRSLWVRNPDGQAAASAANHLEFSIIFVAHCVSPCRNDCGLDRTRHPDAIRKL
jgi:hypothetical protein